MNTSFRNAAILAACIFLALALTWMFAPGVLLSRWGVDLSDSTGLMGRRAAALYAGIGVMFLQARNAAPSPARSALLSGAIVACLLLAALGTVELINGHAGPGILVAVAIEIVLVMAFLYAARTRQTHR
ncbi:peptidoglycan/LPS O-acetylase OafA/YrhL [Rhodoferax ferrireducens]|uniref:Peptidoglycan/LPS O-acetylase OafA/YrhL n=1 Tax=Rhodoferax ferrireducens TaxID=192843 RepID=A0ABU2C7M1_9BURK|nr:hypothetical protein [Rhodoferax ferrireducens]MDR7377237.1 peptidoglycan/LPS O-acetylase OafA/YrhL [Rhodoferax ferrireducens]